MTVSARGLAIAAVRIAVVGAVGATLASLVPAWPLSLFEHFRVQYVWGGALVVAACGVLRIGGWFDAALIATIVNACFVLPDLSARGRPLPDRGAPLRILVLNVHTSNTAFDDVARLVADTKPDVVALLEVNDRWLSALGPALAGYPHRIEEPRPDNFGVALYAKRPLAGAVELLGSELPTLVASLDVHGAPLPLVVTHPIPPISAALAGEHRSQLAAVARRTRELGTPIVVLGDLNATPWSAPFRDLVAATRLCDTRAGFGLQASYPAESLVMRIPIDHVLVSCSIGVRSRVIERDVGSDHLPVVVDLVLPARAPR